MKTKQNFTYCIVMTALLTSIAVVVNFFKIDVPIAGANVLRISFSGPFIRLSSLLFGPIYGGISGGLLDILSYIVKPVGGYILPLTLTAILNGILVGVLWTFVKKYDNSILKLFYIVAFSFVGIVGIVNFIAKSFMPSSFLGQLIISIGKKSSYASEGFIIVSLIGFILLIVNEIFSKKNEYLYETYLKIMISIGIPSVIVTIINTYLFRIFMPELANKMFMIILIPRILEDLLMLPIQTYTIILLMNIYQTVAKKVLV